MLERLSNKEVKGSGFSVFVPNIHQIRYAEGHRVAFIEIEGGTGEYGEVNWVVYQETLRRWETPNESDELSAQKRAEIISNIGESLTLLEMPHKLA